jgi:hypothetical protein
MHRVGQISRHNRLQYCSEHYPFAFKRIQYTNLLEDPEERLTVKHHASVMALFHLASLCCNLQRFIAQLVAEANRNKHWCTGILGKVPSFYPDISEVKMFVAITVQIKHCL